jgi:hypothetical protein
MSGATVTLTFAGDSAQLDKALNKVGDSSKDMATKVTSASDQIKRSTGEGFKKAEEGADGAEHRFHGFADSISGTSDAIEGLSTGDLPLLGTGLADIAGSMTDLFIPAGKAIWTTVTEKVVPAVLSFAASVGETLIAPLVAAGSVIFGTVVPAVWSFTAALLANPIVWVVVGIVALIAILVLLINHFDLVKAAWTAVTSWIGDRVHDVGAFFSWLGDMIPKWIGAAFDWIKSAFWTVVQWHVQAGEALGRVFANIGNAILTPFKWAFNEISDAWNATIGRLSWHVPDWVPFIGGNTISAPRLPKFHSGGTVPGAPGSEMLAVLQAGETVTPVGSPGGGALTVVFGSDGSALGDAIVEIVREAVRKAGGSAQTALGR